LKLHKFIAAHSTELHKEFNALPVHEIRKLEEELTKAQAENDKCTVICAPPKGIQSNVITTFKAMNLEVHEFWSSQSLFYD
jgi:hypothetical protein